MGEIFQRIIEESKASIEKMDLQVLLPIVASINPQNILEIGMHQGYSMAVWRKAFPNCGLIGIEKDKPTEQSYITESGMLWEYNSHHASTLTEVELLLKGGKVDWLFIDGDHSYIGVGQDFMMYAPLVRKGGIIIFHDALYHHAGTEEVDIFWEEIKKEYPYAEIKASKNSTGIGLLFV